MFNEFSGRRGRFWLGSVRRQWARKARIVSFNGEVKKWSVGRMRRAAEGVGRAGAASEPPRLARCRRASVLLAPSLCSHVPRVSRPVSTVKPPESRFASYRAALESCYFLILSGKDVVRTPRSTLPLQEFASETGPTVIFTARPRGVGDGCRVVAELGLLSEVGSGARGRAGAPPTAAVRPPHAPHYRPTFRLRLYSISQHCQYFHLLFSLYMRIHEVSKTNSFAPASALRSGHKRSIIWEDVENCRMRIPSKVLELRVTTWRILSAAPPRAVDWLAWTRPARGASESCIKLIVQVDSAFESNSYRYGVSPADRFLISYRYTRYASISGVVDRGFGTAAGFILFVSEHRSGSGDACPALTARVFQAVTQRPQAPKGHV
ncbi:unnamed protein product [Colias eurytheme]|nr:unnamed protein product [Colias eurytheme]